MRFRYLLSVAGATLASLALCSAATPAFADGHSSNFPALTNATLATDLAGSGMEEAVTTTTPVLADDPNTSVEAATDAISGDPEDLDEDDQAQ